MRRLMTISALVLTSLSTGSAMAGSLQGIWKDAADIGQGRRSAAKANPKCVEGVAKSAFVPGQPATVTGTIAENPMIAGQPKLKRHYGRLSYIIKADAPVVIVSDDGHDSCAYDTLVVNVPAENIAPFVGQTITIRGTVGNTSTSIEGIENGRINLPN